MAKKKTTDLKGKTSVKAAKKAKAAQKVEKKEKKKVGKSKDHEEEEDLEKILEEVCRRRRCASIFANTFTF